MVGKVKVDGGVKKWRNGEMEFCIYSGSGICIIISGVSLLFLISFVS